MKDREETGGGWGVPLLAGMAAGLAAGMFLNSEKGVQMTDDARKRAKAIRKDVWQRAQEAGELSREKYEEMVDGLLEQYRGTRDLTAEGLGIVKKHLLADWEELRAELEALPSHMKRKH
jgi:uncharacterized protein YpuA (DUF1002 family)